MWPWAGVVGVMVGGGPCVGEGGGGGGGGSLSGYKLPSRQQ